MNRAAPDPTGGTGGEGTTQLLNPIDDMVWGIDPGSIQESMRANLPKIQSCYEGWVRANPALGGKLKVQFTIGAEAGDEHAGVRGVELLDSQLDHVAVEGCVTNVVSGVSW